MTREDDRARDEFTSEAEELLDTLSRDLVEFESQGANVRPEVVNKIFREVHSLKGLAGMLGFAEIAELSHNLEDMLDRLRMGKIDITRELTDLLYDSVDSLNRLVIAINDPSMSGLVDVPKLTTRIHQVVAAHKGGETGDVMTAIDLDEQTRKSLTEYEEHRLRENIKAGKQIFSIEMTFDFSNFDERLREVSTALADTGEVISTLPAIDPSGGAGISFRLLYGTTITESEVASHVPDDARTRSLRKGAAPAAPQDRARETAAASIAPPVDRTEALEAATGVDLQHEASVDDEVSLRSISRTVRVDISRLDHVMNIVGELIIEKTHLESLTRSLDLQNSRMASHELAKIARNLDRKLNDLQKSVIEVRMVPVGQVYSKLSRTVRKLARELGKEIDLILRGEDTELDKMMIEELTDPLMHIIRNAIDHGIEPAEKRVAAGKPLIGRVQLEAYQKGNSVVLDVSDDGGGIDPKRIRDVAIKRGLVTPEEVIDAARATEILFTPGFSTAHVVSEISGRGVGLDVVKRNIQDLKGTIEVFSELGKGTTFRISLPITLAIIQALVVSAGDEHFAIPLSSVEESLRIKGKEILTVEGKEVFNLRNLTLPILRLSDAFNLQSGRYNSPDTKWFVVVTRAGERLVGLLVDALVRQQEIVIKSIGERLKQIPGIAGATEVGENEIILVVDIGSLIDHFGSAARTARRSAQLRAS